MSVIGAMQGEPSTDPLSGTGVGTAPYRGTARVVTTVDEALTRVEAVPLPSDPAELARFHWARAQDYGRARLDAGRVRAEADAARAADPSETPSRDRRAWVALDSGLAEEALVLFREDLEERRSNGSSMIGTRFGIALALHAMGDPEAEPNLRRALVESQRHERAGQVRAALGL